MTTNDIDAIEARANAATPGPWQWHGHPFQSIKPGELTTFYSVWVKDKPQLAVKGDDEEPLLGKRDTMIFVAASRQDVPSLCAEVRELRAALERARALLKLFDDARAGACIECGAGFDTGHYEWCKLAAALGEGGRP